MLDYLMLSSLINIGIAVLLITVLAMMVKVSKKKFVLGMVLSIIYAGFVIYYFCLVLFYPRSILKRDIVTVEVPLSIDYQAESTEAGTDFTVIIVSGDGTFSLAPDGELEVRKEEKFKIEQVVYSSGSSDNIKADIKGFAGNSRNNDQQDIGYWVTYANMLRHWAVKGGKDKFEVQIREDNQLLGAVYIKFIE
jgi:hypothetical protein